ncbi:hypothetical protein AAY473_016424 [Plecturocebus cupreus]
MPTLHCLKVLATSHAGKDSCIIRGTVKTPNPATLLPIEAGAPLHDCIETINEVFSSWKYLTDHPLQDPDVEYFTDGSSFIEAGNWRTGCAVVTLDSVIEAQCLLTDTSAQKAE